MQGYTNRGRVPEAPTLLKISEAVGASMEYLLTGGGPEFDMSNALRESLGMPLKEKPIPTGKKKKILIHGAIEVKDREADGYTPHTEAEALFELILLAHLSTETHRWTRYVFSVINLSLVVPMPSVAASAASTLFKPTLAARVL